MAITSDKSVESTREACGLRLGEMIEAIIGDSRLKEIYEAQEKYPHDMEGMSAGQCALKSGIISPDTKTALLVAQAAERTLQLADKVEHFIQNVDTINKGVDDKIADAKEAKEKEIAKELGLKDKRTFMQKAFGLYSAPGMTPEHRREIESIARDMRVEAQKELGHVSLNDNPAFKYVGAEGDHDILKAAQTTHLVAQMYLNNEIDSRFEVKLFPAEQGVSSAGIEFVDGLRKEGAKFYNDAALLMTKEGHFNAADAMRTVAKNVAQTVESKTVPSPTDLLTRMIKDEEWAVGRGNQELSYWSGTASIGSRYGFEPEQQGKLGGMMALADTARKSLLDAAVDNDTSTHQKVRTMKPIQLKNSS